jgi:malate permease and related proteins
VVWILQIQIEIFILIAVGYIITKKGIFGPEARRDMTNVVIYIILPCNIFHSFEMALSIDMLRECAIVFIIGFAAQLIYMLLNKCLYQRFPVERRVVMQYATITNNVGFMGLPVIASVFGATGALYTSIILIPMRLFMWTSGLSLFTSSDKKQQLRQLATHPAIWAVILGFAYLFSPVRLPEFLSGSINVIGSCLTAMSMIVVGSILSEVNFRSLLDKACFYYSAFRLILIPAITFVVLRLMSIDPVVTGVAVLASGMPAATITAMLAKKYGADSAFASKLIFVSTLLSLVTLPIIAEILKSKLF